MRRCGLLLCLTCLAPSGVAQGPKIRSFLHQALLDRAPVILRARFEKDETLPLHDIQVTSFEVLAAFRGSPPKRILVGGMGERAHAWQDLEKILFLRPLSGSRIYELVDLVDLTDQEAGVATEVVASYLALGKEPHALAVNRRLREISLRGLPSSSVFARRVAVEELVRLVAEASYVFEAGDLKVLTDAAGSMPASARASCEKLIRDLAVCLGSYFAGTERAFEPGEPREVYLQTVERFRQLSEPADRITLMDRMLAAGGRRLRLFCEACLLDRSAQVRARAAWYLGELAESDSQKALLQGLETAASEELMARIEALGKLGLQESVDVLRVRLASPATLDAALLALARVGGPEVEILLLQADRMLAGKAEEKERWERIQHYRSPEFGQEEAERRRRARQTYP